MPETNPHRGWLLLVLGVLSVAPCPLLGPIAWAMAKGDLEDMQAGHIDPAGRVLTRIGMILGIVGTAVLFITFVVCLVVAIYWLFVGEEPALREDMSW